MPGSDEMTSRDLMSDTDYQRFKEHAEALCFDSGELAVGRYWHFDPRGFIEQFRKCYWMSKNEFKQVVPNHALRLSGNEYRWE